MKHATPRTGLVLTGGGARAAYQVGVLKGISEILSHPEVNPFPILSGTSAGAINAAALACRIDHFAAAVDWVLGIWRNFHAEHVYRTDRAAVARTIMHWVGALALLYRRNPVSLLDNSPLATLLAHELDFERIETNLERKALAALAVTVSGYSSGASVTFFQAAAQVGAWSRPQSIGASARLTLEHLLASSALPFIFPAVRLNREYCGDGSMRQIAPISPALHLGADRVLVVGTGRQSQDPSRVRAHIYPSVAQIAGHALNSIFLDALAHDIEWLQRINELIRLIPTEARRAIPAGFRHVDVLVMTPSEPVERIAARHLHELPRTIRFLLRPLGAMNRQGSNLASYLLFEPGFTRALIELGFNDTLARRDEVLAFLNEEQLHSSGPIAAEVA